MDIKNLHFRPVLVSEGDNENDENDVDIIFENGKVNNKHVLTVVLNW